MEANDLKRDPASLRILLDKAHFMHGKGYNCAETVAWALSSYWNLDIGIACVTGFGGGISRTGATCGALTGAIAALGAKVGRIDPEDNDKKQLCYRLGQRVIGRFHEEMGGTVCRDLIGFVLAEQGGSERYAAGGFKDGKCRDAIETAVKAAVEVYEDQSA
jgi:C_GCAxxG_C_C family probable redox protein